MGIVLSKFVVEDLLFKVKIDDEIGQMIILGMGEFYFDIIVDCMKCEFKVECNVGNFQVVYCEIFCKFVEVEGKFVCQLGGCG